MTESRREYLPLTQYDVNPMGHVLAVLDLAEDAPLRFTAHSLPGPFDRAYGGQVMSQCLVAASRTLPEGTERLPHSLHGYFLRMGKLGIPIDLDVEVLYDGGSFSNRRVLASQEGKPILAFMASFQESQPGLDFQVDMPEVPEPETLPSNSELVQAIEHPAAWMLLQSGAFDVRHVNGQLYFPNGSQQSERQMVWIRARRPLPDRTSQVTQRALLAYSCDQVVFEPALRIHGLRWATPGTALASLDHAMWFHRDVDVRDWLLYVQDAPSTQGGRGLSRATVFTRSGELVASMTQEGMLRVPDPENWRPQVTGSEAGPGSEALPGTGRDGGPERPTSAAGR